MDVKVFNDKRVVMTLYMEVQVNVFNPKDILKSRRFYIQECMDTLIREFEDAVGTLPTIISLDGTDHETFRFALKDTQKNMVHTDPAHVSDFGDYTYLGIKVTTNCKSNPGMVTMILREHSVSGTE